MRCRWDFGGAPEALAPFLSGGAMGMWQWDCWENSLELCMVSLFSRSLRSLCYVLAAKPLKEPVGVLGSVLWLLLGRVPPWSQSLGCCFGRSPLQDQLASSLSLFCDALLQPSWENHVPADRTRSAGPGRPWDPTAGAEAVAESLREGAIFFIFPPDSGFSQMGLFALSWRPSHL